VILDESVDGEAERVTSGLTARIPSPPAQRQAPKASNPRPRFRDGGEVRSMLVPVAETVYSSVALVKRTYLSGGEEVAKTTVAPERRRCDKPD